MSISDCDSYDFSENETDSEDSIDMKLAECLFRNYRKCRREIVDRYYPRCYERASCEYLVFKPFDSNYDPSHNEMEHIRKYLYEKIKKNDSRVLLMIITREVLATKVHYNVFLWRTIKGIADINVFHNMKTSKFMIHSQDLENPGDRQRVLLYIIEESKFRRFNRYIDYRILQ